MWSEYCKTFGEKEKIRVVISARIRTPSVNLAKRTIYCPDSDIPEMQAILGAMIKHEIAHILYTKGERESQVQNALEDIRVNRKLGSKYLGIAQEFEKVYGDIWGRLFIELKSLHEFPLNDRNLALLFSSYIMLDDVSLASLFPRKAQDIFKENCERLLRKFYQCKNTEDIKKLSEEILKLFEIEPEKDGEGKGREETEMIDISLDKEIESRQEELKKDDRDTVYDFSPKFKIIRGFADVLSPE